MEKDKIFYFLTAYFLSLVLALNFQAIPPLIPFMIRELGITRSQSGLLMGIVSFPPLFFGILGGYILDRWGVKVPVIISLLLYIIGEGLFILGKNFTSLLISRFIIGFGGVIFAVVGLRIIGEKFKGNKLGRAIGYWGTAMPLASILSFNLFPYIAQSFGFKSPMIVLLVFTLFVLLWTLFLYKEDNMEKDVNFSFINLFKSLSSKVIILGVLWGLFNAGSLSFFTFAPDYFVLKGYSENYAAFISSLYMLGSFLSPVLGYLLDVASKPFLFILIGSILLSFFLTLIYFISSPFIVILSGISAVLVPPTVFYLLPKFTKNLGMGYSILNIFVNFSTLISPYLIGYAKDVSGSYFISFILMSLFVLIGGILSLNLER
ncbi:MAG: MFS transporter [Dictyoglomaceae bacterium]